MKRGREEKRIGEKEGKKKRKERDTVKWEIMEL